MKTMAARWKKNRRKIEMKSLFITKNILTIGLVVFLLLTPSLRPTLAYGGDAPLPEVSKTQLQLTPEERAWLAEHPIIYATSEVDWPPFDFVEDGKPTGFSIDYLNLVAKKAGLNISYVTNTWANLQQDVYDKNLDLMHSVVIMPDRQKHVLFTQPYIQATDVLFVRRDEESSSIEEIMGKRIATGEGFASQEFLETNYPDTEIVLVQSELEGLEAVSLNKADGFISWLPVADYLLRTNLITNLVPKFRLGRDEDVALRLAVRNDWPELVTILEKGMNEITSEEYNALYAKWFVFGVLPSDESKITLTEEEKNWLAEHPVIYVTSVVDWPPFDFVEDGEPTGFSIDYLNLVAEKAGLNFSYVTDTWPNLQQSVYDKRLDLAHSLVKNPEREKHVLFTQPYIQGTDALYVRDDDESKTVEEIMQKRIASIKGYASEEFIKRNYPDTEIVYVNSELECIEAVALNKADGFISWLPVANYLLRTKLITNVVPRFRVGQNEDMALRMAVRNDWPELVTILEKGMKQITREEYNALFDKWLIADKLPSEQNKVILTDEEHAWLKEHPVIRVGADPNWAPLEFRDESGAIQGISVDYLKRIRKTLGIEFEFVDKATWGEMLEMARNGELDLLSSVKRTPLREQFLSFTDSYIEMPVAVFNSDERQLVVNLEELTGQRAAVVKGYATEELLIADHPDIIIVPTKNTIEALNLLARGEVEAFVGNLFSTTYYLGQLGYSQIKVAGITPYIYNQRMGVRKDWPLLVSSLQKALDVITIQERNAIKQQWVTVKYMHEYDLSLLWKILGVIVAVIGSAWIFTLKRQITERKDFEQQLITSYERFRAFMDNSIEGIWCVDFDEPINVELPEEEQFELIYKHGYISDANDAYARSVGSKQGKELIGTRIEEFCPRSEPTNVATIKAWIQNRYTIRNAETIETYNDGITRNILNNSVGLIKAGRLERVWGTQTDITERKKAEAKLRTTESKYRSVVENALEGIMIAQDEKVVYSNKKALELSGYTAEEFDSIPITKIIHPSDRSKVMTEYTERISGEKVSSQYAVRLLRKDGDHRFITINATLLEWEGRPASLAMFSDITDLKNAEQKLREHLDMLTHMERRESLGQLTGSIAHELNQPLTGILSDAQAGELLLQQEEMNKGQIEEIFTDIIADAKRASQVIRNLRELFGKKKVELNPLNINALTMDTLRILNSEFINQDVSINTDFSTKLLNVNANRIQLQQLLINLITNSMQAMQRSEKTDKWISINTTLDNDDQVMLCLADNGPGINPDQLETIFEPLTTTKDEGMGMGLAISKSIVQAHGGRIWAENIPQGGTCINLTLPSAEIRS